MPKILLVEDNETNREMLTRRLQRSGYSVCCAADGAAGVAMATSERPDLILMDVALGQMDGWEATQLIRANPTTAAIPIIALTAHALASDRDRSVAVGCSDFDTKPVDMQRLLGKIQALLHVQASGLDDPRVGQRVRTFLKGVLYYDRRSVSIDCIIRDMSDNGARISFPTPVTIPDHVEIDIPQKQRTLFARVQRRDQYEIDVSFDDQRSSEARRASDADLARRVERIEDELVSMKRMLEKLDPDLLASAAAF